MTINEYYQHLSDEMIARELRKTQQRCEQLLDCIDLDTSDVTIPDSISKLHDLIGRLETIVIWEHKLGLMSDETYKHLMGDK